MSRELSAVIIHILTDIIQSGLTSNMYCSFTTYYQNTLDNHVNNEYLGLV